MFDPDVIDFTIVIILGAIAGLVIGLIYGPKFLGIDPIIHLHKNGTTDDADEEDEGDEEDEEDDLDNYDGFFDI